MTSTWQIQPIKFLFFPSLFFQKVCLFTFAGFTGDDSQEAQQADLIHGQAAVGPRCVQAAAGTALLPGHPSHQHHVAPLVLTLLQPAHPSWRDNKLRRSCTNT